MIKVETEKLHKALSLLKYIVPTDGRHPILSFVKVSPSISDGTITLTAIDVSRFGAITIDVTECDEDTDYLIEFENFQRIVSRSRSIGEIIALKYNTRTVTVFDQENGKSVLSSGTLSEFPVSLKPPTDYAEVLPKELTCLLGLGKFADPKSLKLSNIHIIAGNGVIEVEASNGYLGAYGTKGTSSNVVFDIAVDATIEFPLVFQAKNTTDDETWKLSITDNHLFVSGENWYIGFSLLNGDYPPISNIYKNSAKNSIDVVVEDLKSKLENVAVTNQDERIVLEIKQGTVIISNRNNAKHSIQTKYPDQEDNKIILNLYGLLKILRDTKEDTVNIQIGGNPTEPMLIFDGDIMYFILQYSKL